MLGSTYAGVRVIDLSSNLAGPFACMILGDLGADVVKVERPGIGEETRRLPPFRGDQSTVFLSVNRNKRSIELDLKDPVGRDALLRLARRADVVVESYRPGTAERLGLGCDELSQDNPALVYCSISAFGSGPLGRRQGGYDALIQAFTGMMSMTGHPDSPPVRAASSLVDLTTGMWAAMGIMAALARRRDTGQGGRIEAALVDSGFSLLAHQVSGLLATGQVPPRLGSAAPSYAPYEAFRTADGWLMVAAGNDGLFERLCRVVDLPDLAVDSRFATPSGRVQHREVLHDLLEKRFAAAPSETWILALEDAGVPAGPVHALDQALADPITGERRLFLEHEAADLGLLRLPIDTRHEAPRRPPPALGEHTQEVLRESGFTDDDIARIGPLERMGTAP